MSMPRGCCERVTNFVTGSFCNFLSYLQAREKTDIEQKTNLAVSKVFDKRQNSKDKPSDVKCKISIYTKIDHLETLKSNPNCERLFHDILYDKEFSFHTDGAKLTEVGDRVNEELKELGFSVSLKTNEVCGYVETLRDYCLVIHFYRQLVLKLSNSKKGIFKNNKDIEALKEKFNEIFISENPIKKKSELLEHEVYKALENKSIRNKIDKILTSSDVIEEIGVKAVDDTDLEVYKTLIEFLETIIKDKNKPIFRELKRRIRIKAGLGPKID
jgi:hypothetical protein